MIFWEHGWASGNTQCGRWQRLFRSLKLEFPASAIVVVLYRCSRKEGGVIFRFIITLLARCGDTTPFRGPLLARCCGSAERPGGARSSNGLRRKREADSLGRLANDLATPGRCRGLAGNSCCRKASRRGIRLLDWAAHSIGRLLSLLGCW